MCVNSPGGEVDAGLAIYDAMHLVQPKVATTCIGTAVGIAALVVAGGDHGSRAVLPNARMMIHQPSTELEGTRGRHRRSRPRSVAVEFAPDRTAGQRHRPDARARRSGSQSGLLAERRTGIRGIASGTDLL